MLSRLLLTLCATSLAIAACASPADDASGAADELNAAAQRRDWVAHPAIVELDTATDIYAISDIHGGYAELGALLQAHGLVADFASDPAKAADARWTGKSAIFVVAGDLVDKGAESIGVIDFLRALEPKAEAAGGRVIVLMGNHEAEFLADPTNDKALAHTQDGDGISLELKEKGIDPRSLASGTDAEGRGRWLRELPFGARIKKWFFSHGGNTDGDTLTKLSTRLVSAVDGRDGFGAKAIIGNDSILEAQEWWGGNSYKKAGDYAKALGVKHLVFGHDPGALGVRGQLKAVQEGLLVKLNVDMGLKFSSNANLVGGALLHATIVKDAPDHAEQLDLNGETPLF